MITLRVKDPAQAIRFYRDVAGLSVTLTSPDLAHVHAPGLVLALVRDDRLDALHGAGASRHRPGVGVEIHVPVDDPAKIAEQIRTRGGFLVEEAPLRTSARDMDGYLITFESGV
jgi:catechol 2,3-dioxygenase-like lactoylglutathione lyase family enzyme